MSDDLAVQPADAVETVHAVLFNQYVAVRDLRNRPDLVVRPYANRDPKPWAVQALRVTWEADARGRGSVTRRGPWRLRKVQLETVLRLKAGGVSKQVAKVYDMDLQRGTFGWYDDPYPIPEYVVPLLDSMLPFDWDSGLDGVPPWRS